MEKRRTKMNKTEFIEAVADKSTLSKKDARHAFEAMFDTITAALEDGDKVSLAGFGAFDTKVRSERTSRNPKTGEEITIQSSRLPGFKASRSLKDTIKKNT